MLLYPPWNWHSTWKLMVGRLLSVWEGLFSRAMLVLGRVHVYNIHDVQIPHEYPLSLWWISDLEVVRQLDESAPKLPNGIHTEALALCTMLLDSGIIVLNYVDVATSTWFSSMRPLSSSIAHKARASAWVPFGNFGAWHPNKPCPCCLTAALDVLFETLLLECCRIIMVFGLPALPFPWQVQHQRLFRHSTN